MEKPKDATVRTGRCLCRAVTFAARGEPRWVAHCHCESCRRATSSPVATYAGYAMGNVEWTGERPAEYQSSPGVIRRFCRRCGSPMSFEGERWPDEIHLFVPSFEEPENLRPTCHVHVQEQLGWFHLADQLPRYAKTARDGPPLT
ncbi:MAG TPA: GFA family protein [Stellaceae bacterium]|nr:GFA family protein [Stellaceae bacterium]